MKHEFQCIELRVVPARFGSWSQFIRETPDYSIGLEVMDDAPGHIGHRVHFDHHAGVIREVTMSAAMQAYLAVRQGRLKQKWLQAPEAGTGLRLERGSRRVLGRLHPGISRDAGAPAQ